MNALITYTFTARMWQYNPPGGWYFISLPQDVSDEIREKLQWQEEGWGRMKAKAKIGDIKWDTSIWFDSKSKVYGLPIKAEIRRLAKLTLDQDIDCQISI